MVEPKKAGSLIIAKPVTSPSDNDHFDYQILFITRNKGMAFGNFVAFPGGKIEPEDLAFLTKHNKTFGIDFNNKRDLQTNLFKIAALRETYEETGIFLSKPNPDLKKLQAVLESHRSAKTQPQFYSLAEDIGISIGEDLNEFLRLMTPSFMKVRFDAQFFFTKADPSRTFNIAAGLRSFEKIVDLVNLEINQSESTSYVWLNPLQAMTKHVAKEFQLGHPQVLIANVLMSFKKFEEAEKYLKELKAEALNRKTENLYFANPLTFPMIPHFVQNDVEAYLKRDFAVKLMLPADADYPIKEIMGNEKTEKGREEVALFYGTIKNNPTNRCRVYLKKEGLKGVCTGEVNLEVRTPLERLRDTSFLLKGSL